MTWQALSVRPYESNDPETVTKAAAHLRMLLQRAEERLDELLLREHERAEDVANDHDETDAYIDAYVAYHAEYGEYPEL
jgi:hypothetical protein